MEVTSLFQMEQQSGVQGIALTKPQLSRRIMSTELGGGKIYMGGREKKKKKMKGGEKNIRLVAPRKGSRTAAK